MNKAPGKLFYVILSGMILIALIIYSAPAVAAGPSPKGTVAPAMPSEEPPPTNTPMPSPTPTGIPSYFSNPGGPSCVGGGCTLPSGYNVVISAVRNEQSLQAYDPKTGSVFGTGRVETTILVSGAGIGTVSVYYGLSGVSCSGGHSVDIAKRSGNETHLNVPLSGYVDVTLTSLDFGEFTIYTRCKTAGSYVGNFGIDSVWYSLIDVATPTPTAAPTSTPTSTPTAIPTITPTTQVRWYTGNDQSSTYGLKANIWAPAQPIYVEPVGQNCESNWVSTSFPFWVQTGWIYCWWFDKPNQFYESNNPSGYSGIVPVGDHNWGEIIEYKVMWQAIDAEWCAWSDGLPRECFYTGAFPPSYVQARSEVYSEDIPPQTELNTHFSAVYYLDSTGAWQLFDQARWVENPPYSVQKDQYYYYWNYGP